MDDHGHGTHVAGIAAGDGTASNGKFKGVAPDAKLLAYKVLDSYGYGYMSDVIAGIEAAVENKSDVISMSLGGFGDPDDIMCQAVDNAFDMGSVVVVAAGNSGPQRFTITSPGCARKALTVGATKLDDSIAFFSSIGPVPETGQVKPEVYAPGVNIMSAWARKGFMLPARDHEGKYYISLSGTSMATPHVAGVVALIKQQHPNWNAQQIRNTIISSGIPITARTVRSYAPTHLYMTPFMMNISQTPSFEYDTPEFQGNRVDALASVKSECIVYPSAVISLGINFLGDSSPEYRKPVLD
jgi:serine protease AprX